MQMEVWIARKPVAMKRSESGFALILKYRYREESASVRCWLFLLNQKKTNLQKKPIFGIVQIDFGNLLDPF